MQHPRYFFAKTDRVFSGNPRGDPVFQFLSGQISQSAEYSTVKADSSVFINKCLFIFT